MSFCGPKLFRPKLLATALKRKFAGPFSKSNNGPNPQPQTHASPVLKREKKKLLDHHFFTTQDYKL